MSLALKILSIPFLVVGYLIFAFICGFIGLYQMFFGPKPGSLRYDPRSIFTTR